MDAALPSNRNDSRTLPPEEPTAPSADDRASRKPPPDSVSPRSLPRAIFTLTVTFVAGIAATRLLPQRFPEYPFLLLSAILVLVHLLAAAFHGRIPRPWGLPLALFLSLGLTAGMAAKPFSPGHPELSPFLDGRETLCIARVIRPLDVTPDKVRLPLFLQSAIVQGREIPLKASILATMERDWLHPGDFISGDRVMARLRLKRFRGLANPGGLDYERYQAEQGFYGRASIRNLGSLLKISGTYQEPCPTLLNGLRSGTDRFRQHVLAWLEETLPPDAASFYAALLLGYQRLISPQWFDHLARTGVTHLLSIGGLHLGLVSLFVSWVFRGFLRLFLPRILRRWTDQHLALWPALLTAALYAGVAGFSSPPIWRSMLMLAICLVAAQWYRNPDSLSVLALSALGILAMDPSALWQISFQLTFVCMFAIFTLYPRLERYHLSRTHAALNPGRWAGKVLRPFEEAFWMSLAVSIMVVPLTVYYFYGISIAGLIANIILVPLVGFLVLPAGLAAVALYTIHQGMGTFLLELGAWFLGLTQSIILWFSGLSWSYVWVGKPSLFALGVSYTLIAAVLLPWTWRRKALATLGLAFLAVCQTLVGPLLAEKGEGAELRVHVIDVGQGASTLVRFPSGENVLVDGGGYADESFDMGRAVIAPFLWHEGIRRIDHVILSHDHPDHAGGLKFILSHFDVGAFWETPVNNGAEGRESVGVVARRRGIPVRRLTSDSAEISSGSCRLRCLHPSDQFLNETWNRKDLNTASGIVQLDHGDTRCLIPGDIDETVERHVLHDEKSPGQVLLIAAHHGSKRSTSPSLLDRLKPRAVVFSCGFGNPFNFPSPMVLEECGRRGIPIYRTDLDGQVVAVSDGHRWRISKTLSGTD